MKNDNYFIKKVLCRFVLLVFILLIYKFESASQVARPKKNIPDQELKSIAVEARFFKKCDKTLRFEVKSADEGNLGKAAYTALYLIKKSGFCDQSGPSFPWGQSSIQATEIYKNALMPVLKEQFFIDKIDVITTSNFLGGLTGGLVVLSNKLHVWVLLYINKVGENCSYRGLSGGDGNRLLTTYEQDEFFVFDRPNDNSIRPKVLRLAKDMSGDLVTRAATLIQRHNPNRSKTVICAGYDLGGTVSILFATYLEKRESINISALYTFGAPKLICEYTGVNSLDPVEVNMIRSQMDGYFYHADYVNAQDPVGRALDCFNPTKHSFRIIDDHLVESSPNVYYNPNIETNHLTHFLVVYLGRLYSNYISNDTKNVDCFPRPNDQSGTDQH